MAKRALALVVGCAKYPGNILKNPVNDANDITKKLRELGFHVRYQTNCTIEQFDSAVDSFGDELNKYDVGLFFFAGHGLQIAGENFVTATNTNFTSEPAVKYSSVPLNKIVSLMESASCETRIVILDACRDNPYVRGWTRGIANMDLAPIYAPKGTIIAYATSPGERASDGVGNNGLYTAALLKHLDDENIPIEELFKRVRATVSAFSSGKQTSWEHTSLIGNFYFNTGLIAAVTTSLYSQGAIADRNYKPGGTDVDQIISGLLIRSWNAQNRAIDRVASIDPKTQNADALFVLGRNILQSAHGSAFSVQSFFTYELKTNLESLTTDGVNHVLNGILFEMYFNADGKFRYDHLKTFATENVMEVLADPQFAKSLEFIQEQLKPYEEFLFAVPSNPPHTVSLNIISEFKDNEHYIRSVIHEGREVMIEDSSPSFFTTHLTEPMRYIGFKHRIASQIAVPINQITFNSNENLNDQSPVRVPYGRTIKKAM